MSVVQTPARCDVFSENRSSVFGCPLSVAGEFHASVKSATAPSFRRFEEISSSALSAAAVLTNKIAIKTRLSAAKLVDGFVRRNRFCLEKKRKQRDVLRR